MSINEETKFICNICGKNHFKSNKALKIHQHWHNPEYWNNISEKIKANWHNPERRINMSEKIKQVWQNPEYRKNISEKIKALRQDPNSNYNKRKIENKPKEIVKSNKPKEIVKPTNPQFSEYFEKYLKMYNYLDHIHIVKDYIREKYNGRQLQTNTRVNIEQNFDLLIQNYLETGKIGLYSEDTPPIYRKIRATVSYHNKT